MLGVLLHESGILGHLLLNDRNHARECVHDIPCSVSNLLKSLALFTSSLSRSKPFGLLCLRLALLFSPAVGQAPSVLSTMSPDRRCTSRCPLALVASFSLFTTCSLAVVQSLFSPQSPCGCLRLRGSPRASPTPLLSLRHFVIIGSR